MRWWILVILVSGFSIVLLMGGDKEKKSQLCKSVEPSIFAKELKQRGGILLDVRTPEEFIAGHLEGAKNLNFYDDDFSSRVKEMAKETAVFVYCKSGGRSGKTLKMMEEAGFQIVFDMSGGFLRWNKEGRPVVTAN